MFTAAAAADGRGFISPSFARRPLRPLLHFSCVVCSRGGGPRGAVWPGCLQSQLEVMLGEGKGLPFPLPGPSDPPLLAVAGSHSYSNLGLLLF